LVGPLVIEVLGVLAQQVPQVPLAEHHEVVQTFLLRAPHPPLGAGVQVRGERPQPLDGHASCA
jgi:hypothetical protein